MRRPVFYRHSSGSGEIALHEEYIGAGVLRANVYIDEKKFLPSKQRDENDTEHDVDDQRSRHYVVLERCRPGTARVIGNMRTIVKQGLGERDLLPAEKFFPSVFEGESPAPVNSIEASRFIARHENRLIQHAVFMSLMRTVIVDAFLQDNMPIYAVVEETLRRRIEQSGLPFEQLHEVVEIEEYDYTMNMLLRFNPRAVLEAMASDTKGLLPIAPFFEIAGKSNGSGYYGKSLLAPV